MKEALNQLKLYAILFAWPWRVQKSFVLQVPKVLCAFQMRKSQIKSLWFFLEKPPPYISTLGLLLTWCANYLWTISAQPQQHRQVQTKLSYCYILFCILAIQINFLTHPVVQCDNVNTTHQNQLKFWICTP